MANGDDDALECSADEANQSFSSEPVGSTTATCEAEPVWLWDSPHTNNREQYVNLPAGWDPPNNGRTVRLAGHVEPRFSGISVAFNVIANTSNDSGAPAARLASLTATTDGNGDATADLTLPVYGGARFSVGGRTEHMSTPAMSGELTVWRKVFYQTTKMANSPAPENLSLAAPSDMISALRGAFNPVFFKIVASEKSSATTPYQAHLTAGQRRTLGNSLRASARDARSPYKMNIVIIDRADIVAEQEWTNAATTANVQLPTYYQVWGHQPSLIRAQYQAAGNWKPLTSVREINDPTDSSRAYIRGTIPGFVAGSTVNVRIKYRYKRGNAGGWGGTTGTLFMCIGRQRRASASSPTGAQLQQALTHEIGHALGLVPNGAAWRDPDPRDAPYSLKHCRYKSGSTPRCVMWFMLGGSGARLRFCSSNIPNDCAHFLKRSDYSSMSWI